MIRPPIIEPVGDNYVIIEPPAGMLKLLNERVEQLKKLESKFVMMDFSCIWVLVCLHSKQTIPGKPEAIVTYHSTAVSIAAALDIQNCGTLRNVFANASEEDFIKVISEFQFNYPRTVIESVFDKIDELCFITKKKVDDEKKD